MARIQILSILGLVTLVPACSKMDTKDTRNTQISPIDGPKNSEMGIPTPVGENALPNKNEPDGTADAQNQPFLPGSPHEKTSTTAGTPTPTSTTKSGPDSGMIGGSLVTVEGIKDAKSPKSFDSLVPTADCAKSLGLAETAVMPIEKDGTVSIMPNQAGLFSTWGNKADLSVELKPDQTSGTNAGFCAYVGGNQNSLVITVQVELPKIRVYSTGNAASVEIKIPKGAAVKAFDIGFGALPGEIKISGEGTYDCEKGLKWTGSLFSSLTCNGKKIN